MLGWEFPPLISGGLGVACQGIARGLAQEGVKITLLVPRYYSNPPKFLKLVSAEKILSHQPSQAIDISELLPLGSAYISPEDYENWYKKALASGSTIALLYGPTLFYEVEKFAKASEIVASKVKFDIIHCHDWMTYKAGMSAKKVSGVPLVAHVHSIENDRSPFCNPKISEIEKFGLENADLVLCVSKYTMNRVKQVYGIPENKMAVAYNGIELNCGAPLVKKPKKKRLNQALFFGRITWQKGPDYFIETAKKMLKQRSNLRFVLAGWGDKAVPLIEYVANLRLGNKILFAGFLNERELKALLHNSDVFLVTSISEPFGLVALEGLSQGVPAVISKQSGISEILTSIPSADYWDTEKFAQYAFELIDNPELGKNQIQEIWPVLKKTSWSNNGKTILSYYQKILGN